MSPRPENAVGIWLSPDHIMALYLDGETLKRRSSNDGGATWSDAIVVHEGVTGFSAQYHPRERRIKGLMWRDFETDEKLSVIDIGVPDEACGTCHGEVGHRINCPEGIAFSKYAPAITHLPKPRDSCQRCGVYRDIHEASGGMPFHAFSATGY